MITGDPPHLDSETLNEFRRSGVAVVRRAFTGWVEPLRAALESNLAEPGPWATENTSAEEPGRFFDDYCNWNRIPTYEDFVRHSGAAALAAALLGVDRIRLFHEHVFVKENGTRHGTPWHQDLPYYCVDGRQTVTIYLPLDPMGRETGVEFLVGSHRDDRLYRPAKFLTGKSYPGRTDLAPPPSTETLDRSRIVVHELEPGDALVFDFRTLHGSPSTVIEGRRRAFTTRWIGADVRYVDRGAETSPPYPELNGLRTGDPLPEDLFPFIPIQPDRAETGARD
ncbi:MAG TPA: phytanoyl-CoA dioxygenase [Acidimicrobiales bacterium]|nr:phytanoyl-CoA dioxygenase [Acidimicrobiales bacterium]